MTLKPGQFQIGDFVFGDRTWFSIETCDIGGYDMNIQDFQSTSSDELRMGLDTIKPLPIQFTINYLRNRLLPNVIALEGLSGYEYSFENDPLPVSFAREWRADEYRHAWGELKPLLFCREDGTVVRIYGRPGKISISRSVSQNDVRKIVCEYRRSDALAYSDIEWWVHSRPNEIMTIARSENYNMGDGPSWIRFVLIGPMIHPIIQFGSQTIELDYELDTGQVAEISTYPWSRRAIDVTNGLNINTKLISPYLDRIKFPSNTAIELSWTATGLNETVENVDFTLYSDGDLPPVDWPYVSYNGSGAGEIQISSGLCIWEDAGSDDRLGSAIYSQYTVSDYQRVGFIMDTPADATLLFEECGNRIIGRSNETGTEYVYWEITYTRCWFGKHVNGVDYILSEPFWLYHILRWLLDIIEDFFSIFGIGENGGPGWKYEAEFGSGDSPYIHTLWINGHRAAVFQEGDTAQTTVGASYRYSGFGMRATNRLWGQVTPGYLSSWFVRDNPPPDIAETLDASTILMLWRDAWSLI